MQLKGDIMPDYENNILTVIIYTMSTPRENEVLKEIIQILNDSETKFPGTNLTLLYKFATKWIAAGLDLWNYASEYYRSIKKDNYDINESDIEDVIVEDVPESDDPEEQPV